MVKIIMSMPGYVKLAITGKTKAVMLLLELTVNVNAVTKCNRTTLLLAIKKGHIEIVKMLLEVKFNMHACEQQGSKTLHLAFQRNYSDTAQLPAFSRERSNF